MAHPIKECNERKRKTFPAIMVPTADGFARAVKVYEHPRYYPCAFRGRKGRNDRYKNHRRK